MYCEDLIWVFLQLKAVGLFSSLGYHVRSCVVEQIVFLCRATSQRELCFESRSFFSLLNFTSWLLLTVTLLCQRSSSQYYCVLRGSYFHSASTAKGWGRIAYRCPLMTPCTPVGVYLQCQTDSYRGSWSWTMTCNSSGCLCHFPCLSEVIWCCCGNQV